MPVNSLRLHEGQVPYQKPMQGGSAYYLAERLHAAGDDRAVDYLSRTIAWIDGAVDAAADCRAPLRGHCSSCI